MLGSFPLISSRDRQELLTLTQVLQQARVGDADLAQVETISLYLFRSLLALRVPSDLHVLPNPQKFRGGVKGRRLNRHQLCEREMALVRQTTGHPSKRTSRAAAWRAVSASLKTALGAEEQREDIASGLTVLYAPLGMQQWRLGFVLSVWRAAAKGGSKLTVYPVPIEGCRALRVTDLAAVPNAPMGQFRSSATAFTSAIPIHRLGLVLQASKVIPGLDGIQVNLAEREVSMVEEAARWTKWGGVNSSTNLKLNNKKRKAGVLELAGIIILDDDDENDGAAMDSAEKQPQEPKKVEKPKESKNLAVMC